MRIFQNSMLSDSRLSLTGRSATEAFGVWLGTQRECFADDSSHPGRRYLADFERGSADHRPESGYRLEPPSDWEGGSPGVGLFCYLVTVILPTSHCILPAEGDSRRGRRLDRGDAHG